MEYSRDCIYKDVGCEDCKYKKTPVEAHDKNCNAKDDYKAQESEAGTVVCPFE